MQHTSNSAFLLALSISALSTSVATAATRFVHHAAFGSGDGSSWSNAHTRLDTALAAANAGDEIWVASGTYTPPNAATSFALRSSVRVYGGFSGNETLRGQRNWIAHPTILSGDIGQDDMIDPNPFGPGWPFNVIFNTANAAHVVVADGVDSTSVLDGFSIVKGNAVGSGGGFQCVNGNPVVTNCAFADCFAQFGHGGAIYLASSNASITHCTFYHNLAYQGSGGAIFVGGTSLPTIHDCTFSTNEAVSTNGQTGLGGAIQLSTSTAITISRCVFDGNLSVPFAGGSFEIPRGGAIHSFCITGQPRPTTTIRECIFRNNQAAHGGAVFAWNPTTILNSTFDHNIAYGFGNGGGEGAGICGQWTTLTVLNCTLAYNAGGESGGLAVFDDSPNFPGLATIRNSIIWGNTASGQNVTVRDPSVNGPFTARNSCIEHLFSSDPGEDPIDPSNYPGCTISNPLMIAPGIGNVQLMSTSPCIDTGNNSLVPAGTPVDLGGLARIVRGLPGPGTSRVDMGAYEFGSQTCAPVILTHPTDTLTCRHQGATFSVAASGSGPLSFQWRRNSVALDVIGNPSAATTALSLPSVQQSDAGSYDCVVTNACGNVTSFAALLSLCSADFNCDSTVDFFDYLDFVDAFSSSSMNADFNEDSVIDFFDYLDFVDAFSSGC